MYKFISILILLVGIIASGNIVLASSPLARAVSNPISSPISEPISAPIIVTTLIVNPTFSRPGSKLAISGSGYQINSTVYLIWDETKVFIPSNKTNSNGSFKATLSVPLKAAFGFHTIRAKVNGVTSPTVNVFVLP